VRKVLLSTGLVGSWFFSCANMSVRKFVPPSVVPLTPAFAAEPAPVEPVPVPMFVVAPVPAATAAAPCVPLMIMMRSY
jgi:hypothetical protein